MKNIASTDRKRSTINRAGSIFALAIALTIVLAAMSGTGVAYAQDATVVGIWVNQLYMNTPSGSVPIGVEFVSCESGGTLHQRMSGDFSSQNPAVAGTPLAANFSAGFGTWKRAAGSSAYAITIKRFVFATEATPGYIYDFSFPGQAVGVETIEALVTLHHSPDGDTVDGPWTLQIVRNDGYEVFAASGTFSGARLEIEPLAEE